jgi:hypothetical protein
MGLFNAPFQNDIVLVSKGIAYEVQTLSALCKPVFRDAMREVLSEMQEAPQ